MKMTKDMYTVKAFASLTGVTERTLHYYDRKGLLTPTSYTSNGHRLYSKEDIFKMQKILTLKYLGFTLKDIMDYLAKNSTTDLHNTLSKQKQLLEKKRDEIDHIIETISRVEQLIQAEEVNSDLLLTIIHSIQNEKIQEQWLTNQLSEPAASQVMMRHLSKEEKRQIELDLLHIVNALQNHFDNSIPPHHVEVQQLVAQLDASLEKIVDPVYQEELKQLETDEMSVHYLSQMSKSFQHYIEEATALFNENRRTSK